MAWTAEKMMEKLKDLLGDRLVSVVLYGSAAAGDHAGRKSDVNLMVVIRSLGPEELGLLSEAVIPWVKQGNHPPHLLAEGRLADLTDVFPIEILDMQHNHRVLFGKDPLEGLSVDHEHLRVELEHELRGKLMRLRSRYVLSGAKSGEVERLMVESLSTFLVLFKNALRLFGEEPPAVKMEALRRLTVHVPFDLEPFETVDRLKRGEKVRGLDARGLFGKYMASIEAVVESVNR